MARPLIALLGLPDLVEPVRDAGHVLLTPETDLDSIHRAVTDVKSSSPGQPVILVVANPDLKAHGWLVTLAAPVHVLVLHSDELPNARPIPNARQVEIPATVDELFAVFGAPGGRGPGGTVLVRADGRTKDEPAIDPSFMEWNDEPDPAPAQAPSLDFGSDDFVTPASPVVPTAVPEPAPSVPEPDVTDADDLSEFISKPPAPATNPDVPQSFPTPAAPPVPVDPGPPVYDAPPPPARPTRIATPVSVETVEDVLPAPAPAAPAQIQPAPGFGQRPTVDLDDLIDASPVTAREPGSFVPYNTEQLAPVIFVVGAKGGVGKSTSAMAIAERAGKAGLGRVSLVDGSPFQSDIVKYLRLNKSRLPNLYDAAITGDPARALVTPDVMRQARGDLLPGLSFAVVLGPVTEQARQNVITPEVYARQIAYLRTVSSLVIVDTQIQEAFDAAGFFEQVWLPMLAEEDAWCVYVMDTSRPGIMNAIERLQGMRDYGVRASRTMAFVNKAVAGASIDANMFQSRLAQYATFLGVVPDIPTIHNSTQAGVVPQAVPEYAVMLDRILHRVTGLPAFDPDRPDGPGAMAAGSPKKSGGLFGRFGRR